MTDTITPAQRLAVRKAVTRIHGHRPYLDVAELERHVFALPKSVNWDAKRWAEHCLMLVEHGRQLPWEQDPKLKAAREDQGDESESSEHGSGS